MLRCLRIDAAVLHLFVGPNIDLAPRLKRLHSRGFTRFNFALSSTDVCPVTRRMAANGQIFDENVRFPVANRKTVTGPPVRASTSLKLSRVNSPLPDVRSSLKPIVAGGASPLPDLSESSVVPKFSRKSIDQLHIDVPDQHWRIRVGRNGGFFATRVNAEKGAGERSRANAKSLLADECARNSTGAQKPMQPVLTDALRSSRNRAARTAGLLDHFPPERAFRVSSCTRPPEHNR